MKSRFGYVSNSSSSSFLVYGLQTETYDDIREWLEEGRTVYCIDEGAGTSGDCEDFVFKMTPERFDLLKKYEDRMMRDRCVDIICADSSWIECLDEKVGHPDLSGGMFFHFYRDYSSPQTEAVDDKDFLEWIKYRLGGE